jgi:hypothetical protein
MVEETNVIYAGTRYVKLSDGSLADTYIFQVSSSSQLGRNGTENVSQADSLGNDISSWPPCSDEGSTSIRGLIKTIYAETQYEVRGYRAQWTQKSTHLRDIPSCDNFVCFDGHNTPHPVILDGTDKDGYQSPQHEECRGETTSRPSGVYLASITDVPRQLLR